MWPNTFVLGDVSQWVRYVIPHQKRFVYCVYLTHRTVTIFFVKKYFFFYSVQIKRYSSVENGHILPTHQFITIIIILQLFIFSLTVIVGAILLLYYHVLRYFEKKTVCMYVCSWNKDYNY